jgi:hypothetical protein
MFCNFTTLYSALLKTPGIAHNIVLSRFKNKNNALAQRHNTSHKTFPQNNKPRELFHQLIMAIRT